MPIAKAMVYCDGVGVGSSDWTMFNYEHLRRPIYPLDEKFGNEPVSAKRR
jgi:microcystin degradation protein MlrC